MRKVIIALVLSLTFIAPASASASDTATATAKLATKISLDAKAKAELAMAKALQAEKISLKTVNDVNALRFKTMTQLQSIKKQLDALSKLLKKL
jgi:hypothetical protein